MRNSSPFTRLCSRHRTCQLCLFFPSPLRCIVIDCHPHPLLFIVPAEKVQSHSFCRRYSSTDGFFFSISRIGSIGYYTLKRKLCLNLVVHASQPQPPRPKLRQTSYPFRSAHCETFTEKSKKKIEGKKKFIRAILHSVRSISRQQDDRPA